jgi:hypothetical protein
MDNEIVNAAQFSKRAGVAYTSVIQYIKSGKIDARQDGGGHFVLNYSNALEQLRAWKNRKRKTYKNIKHIDEETQEHPPEENAETKLKNAQLKKAVYDAEKAELEYKIRNAQLVQIDQVAQEVEKEYSTVRTLLLALPAKLAPEIMMLDTELEIKNCIENAIYNALKNLTRKSGKGKQNESVGSPAKREHKKKEDAAIIGELEF